MREIPTNNSGDKNRYLVSRCPEGGSVLIITPDETRHLYSTYNDGSWWQIATIYIEGGIEIISSEEIEVPTDNLLCEKLNCVLYMTNLRVGQEKDDEVDVNLPEEKDELYLDPVFGISKIIYPTPGTI